MLCFPDDLFAQHLQNPFSAATGSMRPIVRSPCTEVENRTLSGIVCPQKQSAWRILSCPEKIVTGDQDSLQINRC
ncbi:hypothetical protein RRG08_059732 [Elysia crispata]|uniref:Uncharacterized protein n=1 Tax=Elysia crispata TaxID=231223 RepID=A0AAE1D1W9_9GAST|nr:hypothetical protein RRG08_059732 [Elysia crispata]